MEKIYGVEYLLERESRVGWIHFYCIVCKGIFVLEFLVMKCFIVVNFRFFFKYKI